MNNLVPLLNLLATSSQNYVKHLWQILKKTMSHSHCVDTWMLYLPYHVGAVSNMALMFLDFYFNKYSV